LLVAVDASVNVMRTGGVLALSNVQGVVRRKVWKAALVAVREPCLAPVSSMAPLEASGALTSRGRDSPGLASPSDARERD
jgi:hypothetical protein